MNLLKPIFAAALLFALAGCANTIRGVGQDATNTINATSEAVEETTEAIVD
jgi:entericidin B